MSAAELERNIQQKKTCAGKFQLARRRKNFAESSKSIERLLQGIGTPGPAPIKAGYPKSTPAAIETQDLLPRRPEKRGLPAKKSADCHSNRKRVVYDAAGRL